MHNDFIKFVYLIATELTPAVSTETILFSSVSSAVSERCFFGSCLPTYLVLSSSSVNYFSSSILLEYCSAILTILFVAAKFDSSFSS